MTAESKAFHDEQGVAEGMKRLELRAEELKTTAGSGPRKVVIAQAVHRQTALTGQRTAARLEMKSAVNVCQQVKRLRVGKLKLPKEAKRWLSGIDS